MNDLTQFLIDDWTKAPDYVRAEAAKLEGQGSVAIGRHPSVGWFVVLSQGQGSALAWDEDSAKLAGDWAAVGGDLERAMKRYDRGDR